MNPSALHEHIHQRAPHLSPSFLQAFLSQMDPEYFEQFSLETILKHLDLTAQLTFEEPCSVDINTLSSRQYQIHLVAYDYFSEFAIFCGILASFGLGYSRGGNIHLS